MKLFIDRREQQHVQYKAALSSDALCKLGYLFCRGRYGSYVFYGIVGNCTHHVSSSARREGM